MFVIRIIFISFILFSASYSTDIRILTTEEPPTNYTSKDGKITGITTDIIEEIKKILNIKQKIEMHSWARSYMIAKNNPNVIAYTAAKTQKRINQGFYFIGPITTKRHMLWSKKENNIQITSLKNITSQNIVVGAMRGDWRADYLSKKGFIVHEVNDHRQNIKKLLHNRIDLLTVSDIEIPLIVEHVNVDLNRLKKVYTFSEGGSYILISKNTSKELIKNWEKAYKKLQNNGFLLKLATKWSNILGQDLKYTNEKGFFID